MGARLGWAELRFIDTLLLVKATVVSQSTLGGVDEGTMKLRAVIPGTTGDSAHPLDGWSTTALGPDQPWISGGFVPEKCCTSEEFV